MNGFTRRFRRTAFGAVMAGFVLAGCGVPSDGQTREISTGSVPYRLLDARPASPSASLAAGQVISRITLVTADGRLRLVKRSVSDGSSKRMAQELLSNLEVGPNDQERRDGLESAVPVGSRLWIASLHDGVLVISLSDEAPDQASDRLPLMVGQLVLTVTSVSTIHGVRLQQGGQLIEAPLMSGSLTSAVLVRADYAPLLAGAEVVDPAGTLRP